MRELAPRDRGPGDARARRRASAQRIEFATARASTRLRRAAVHNDPNDYNVLVRSASGSSRSGILDFGDIVHSYAIADLAIAVAYAVLGKPDPLAAAVSRRARLPAAAAARRRRGRALFGLVLLRLCTSVCIAARQQKQRPGRRVPGDQPGADRADAAGAGRARSGGRRSGVPRTRAGERRRRRWRRAPRVIGRNLSVAYRRPREDRARLDAVPLRPRRAAIPRRLQQRAARRPLATRASSAPATEQMLRAQHQHALPARQAGDVRRAARGDAAARRCGVCYFVNSGSEANELALRLARAHTRRRDVDRARRARITATPRR